MASHQPAQLEIGTEVSAKFNGAFCEAHIKRILVKNIRLKVSLNDKSVVEVNDESITSGSLTVGTTVLLKHPSSGQIVEGMVKKVQDDSLYEVCYTDEDLLQLKRSSIFPKGDKHFNESENLDNLPLSNPEHFLSPVLKKNKGMRGRSGKNECEKNNGTEDEPNVRSSYMRRNQDLVGEVMILDVGDRRKETPVLVVLPDASSSLQCKTSDQVLVRSFKDNKFMVISVSDLKEFNPDVSAKMEDKSMKTAHEKAQQWIMSSQLPSTWNREELLGPLQESDDTSDVRSEEFDDDEQSEENDRFVAQLYKFMDDRSTPLVKSPSLGNKDLNLYRLFKVVQSMGGFNKVGTRNSWKEVYDRMGLPPCQNPGPQVKNAYKRYLHAFEDFYRKLGSSMGTLSRPGRLSRQSTSRGILSFRIRDKDSSPHSPRPDKSSNREDKSKDNEKKPKNDEPAIKVKEKEGETEEATAEVKSGEEAEAESVRRSTPRREKVQKEEPKREEARVKKEEDRKEESPSKEDRKKEEASRKREERKSLRQSVKEKEVQKEGMKVKERGEEEKKDVKKDESKPVRVLRKDNEKEEEAKKDLDDPKKRITRRKSNRADDDKKDDVDEDDDKEGEKKEKKPLIARKEKGPKPHIDQDEDSDEKDKESEKEDDDDSSTADSQDHEELPLGTRLRVRYGRGRNQKIYEAKIVEHGTDGSGARKTYLVHYAGWNVRYDEWIKSDRIVAVVEKPDMPNSTPKPKKIKLLNVKPLKGSTTPPQTKSEMPASKKRGRQPSVQQAPSPGGSSTKSFGTGDTPKTHKAKASSSTLASSVSKTRSTRSNSTELKLEPGLGKSRITRRSSGLNESVGEQAASEADRGSDSDVESEVAPASMEDAGSMLEEDDATKDSSMDISMEEPIDSPSVKDTDLDSLLAEESDAAKPEDSKTKLTSSGCTSVQTVLEETAETELPKIVPSEAAAAAAKDIFCTEPRVKDATEGTREVTHELESSEIRPVIEKEVVSKVESTSRLCRSREGVVVKDELVAEESEEAPSSPPGAAVVPSLEAKPEEEITLLQVEDLAIPQLKKIDLDISPCDDKKEGKDKEKQKLGKKQGRETKKSRQNDMRSSISEIPTLEPMMTTTDVKPLLDISPSPYDFNDADVSGPWQAEHPITKKWEPNSKLLIAFRDVKMELKKSLEAEKKKVKKKSKKIEKGLLETSQMAAEAESPSKSAEKPAKEPIPAEIPQSEKPLVKKKGRKKKVPDADAKMDTSSYEETVNSVVESCKADAALLDDVPLSVLSEPKDDKLVKKRKSKVLEANITMSVKSNEADIGEGVKKASKGLKGKVGRKKKEIKSSDSSLEIPDLSLSQNTAAVTFLPARLGSLETLELVPCKVPRLEMDQPSGDFASSVCPAETVVTGWSASPAVTASRPGPSTSGNGTGSAAVMDRLGVLPEESASDSRPGGVSHVNFIVDVSKPPCDGGVRNTVLNTPPTTPENDSDEVNSGSSSSEGQDNLKEDSISLDSGERTSKQGSESPPGCDISLSSASSENLPSSSSCARACSKPTHSSETVGTKRKRKDESGAPLKKKKRLISRVTRSERGKNSPRYGDEDSQSRSPLHQNGVEHNMAAHNSSNETPKSGVPRQPKFHFTDDMGEHLEGEARIQFILEKMKEIRKLYVGLKTEVTVIERKRKRARRREKERDSSQASLVDKEAS